MQALISMHVRAPVPRVFAVLARDLQGHTRPSWAQPLQIIRAAARRPAAALLGFTYISFKWCFIALLTNTRSFIHVFVLWLDWLSFESLFHAIIVSCGAVILHISAWERLGGKVKDFCAVYGGWDGSFPFEADKQCDLWLLCPASALMVWSNSFFTIIASR